MNWTDPLNTPSEEYEFIAATETATPFTGHKRKRVMLMSLVAGGGEHHLRRRIENLRHEQTRRVAAVHVQRLQRGRQARARVRKLPKQRTAPAKVSQTTKCDPAVLGGLELVEKTSSEYVPTEAQVRDGIL